MDDKVKVLKDSILFYNDKSIEYQRKTSDLLLELGELDEQAYDEVYSSLMSS